MNRIRSSVTVSLVPEARGGPFVFWDDLFAACRKAKELGFDAIEAFLPGPDAGRLRAAIEENGLALAAVGTGAGWVKHRLTLTSGDAATRAKARDFIRAMIDTGGALGAPAIIGSMQGRSGDGVDAATARAYLAEALGELGEHAAQYGVPLLYEPLNRYETDLCNTAQSAAALLLGLSSRNVKILCDLFHMNIEEEDIADGLHHAGELLGHVHFVDSNRRAAGMGHLDYWPIAAALEIIGYEGFASAECLPLPNPEKAASRTIAAFREVFGPRRSE